MTGRPTLPDDLRTLNVRDFFEDAVRQVPSNEFIVGRSGSLSYGEVDAMANQAASAWEELGVGKGDRVAFMADNSAEFIAAWLGLAKLGAVMAAVNTRFKPAEVQYVLEHSRPSYVLASPGACGRGAGRRRCGRAGGSCPCARQDRSRRRPARADRGGRADFTRVPLEASDVVSFIYTSGTTGRPKAVMQTHGNYVLTGQAYPTWLRLTRGDDDLLLPAALPRQRAGVLDDGLDRNRRPPRARRALQREPVLERHPHAWRRMRSTTSAR